MIKNLFGKCNDTENRAEHLAKVKQGVADELAAKKAEFQSIQDASPSDLPRILNPFKTLEYLAARIKYLEEVKDEPEIAEQIARERRGRLIKAFGIQLSNN